MVIRTSEAVLLAVNFLAPLTLLVCEEQGVRYGFFRFALVFDISFSKWSTN